MPVRRRTRVPRRGRASFRRKRRTNVRRRRIKSAKRKSKTGTRRTRLTQGFPRSSTVTLKYVDTVYDVKPKYGGNSTDKPHEPADDGNPITRLHQFPGLTAFSCNDPGMPDVNAAFTHNSLNQAGRNPHQPLGYDQYTLLYKRAKVLRSSAKFTVRFVTRNAFSMNASEEDTETAIQANGNAVMDMMQVDPATGAPPLYYKYPVLAQLFGGAAGTGHYKGPPGLYVGMLKMNSVHPIVLPQSYSEFLERFKAPLKFMPFRKDQAGTVSATFYGHYAAPSAKYLRSLVAFSTYHAGGSDDKNMDSMRDFLTVQTGDYKHPGPQGPEGSGPAPVAPAITATRPAIGYFWQLVVYMPDHDGQFRLIDPSVDDGAGGPSIYQALATQVRVQLRYRVRFSMLRQLKRSSLFSTPGISESYYGHGLPAEGEGTAAVQQAVYDIDTTAPDINNTSGTGETHSGPHANYNGEETQEIGPTPL